MVRNNGVFWLSEQIPDLTKFCPVPHKYMTLVKCEQNKLRLRPKSTLSDKA